MSNLDLHSFDVSNLSEIVVSSTKFQNKETFQRTSRSRDASDVRSSDRRQRSQERGRQYTKGSSPGRDKARHRSNSRSRYDQRAKSTSRDRRERMGRKCLRCGGDHEAKDCSMDYSGEKCILGCDLYHQMKDCPKKKYGNTRESRQSKHTAKMVYKRYRSPGGRSSSFTRNDKGDRF